MNLGRIGLGPMRRELGQMLSQNTLWRRRNSDTAKGEPIHPERNSCMMEFNRPLMRRRSIFPMHWSPSALFEIDGAPDRNDGNPAPSSARHTPFLVGNVSDRSIMRPMSGTPEYYYNYDIDIAPGPLGRRKLGGN